MIYAAIYILLCLLVPLGRTHDRRSVAILAIVSILLFLFVGFRWEVGCDWTGYQNIYWISGDKSPEEILADREPGFGMLNYYIRHLDLDYYYINVVEALIFFVGLFLFALKQENPLAIVALSFPILIMNMPMSAVRQAIAIGFIMMAINAFRDGKRLTYAGAVLAGGTFHQSSILFLGLAPLIRLRLTIWTAALSAILAAPGLYYLFASTFDIYTQRYGGNARDAFGAPYRAALLAVVGITFVWLFRARWRKAYPQDYAMYWLAAVAMIATVPITLYSSIVGDRIGYYLIPFQIVILERMPFLFRGSRYVLFLEVVPYLVLLVFFATWLATSSLFQRCYVPYQSLLFNM